MVLRAPLLLRPMAGSAGPPNARRIFSSTAAGGIVAEAPGISCASPSSQTTRGRSSLSALLQCYLRWPAWRGVPWLMASFHRPEFAQTEGSIRHHITRPYPRKVYRRLEHPALWDQGPGRRDYWQTAPWAATGHLGRSAPLPFPFPFPPSSMTFCATTSVIYRFTPPLSS